MRKDMKFEEALAKLSEINEKLLKDKHYLVRAAAMETKTTTVLLPYCNNETKTTAMDSEIE